MQSDIQSSIDVCACRDMCAYMCVYVHGHHVVCVCVCVCVCVLL